MHLIDELPVWCIDLLTHDLFIQIAPFVILILLPTLAFLVVSRARSTSLLYSLAMGLDSLGISIPWVWSQNSAQNGPVRSSTSERKKPRKHIRTRAEQVSLNGTSKHDTEDVDCDDGYYPGLVNISGTYCFMNSTLQALASLSYLQPHIDAIHAKAEALDVPTPVIDALQDLFHRLNTPQPTYHSIRPLDIIEVLSRQTEGRTNSLFYSREHQDAQELFQLLSECLKNEIAAVDKEGCRDRGLGGLSMSPEISKDISKSVFDGLTANRRSCIVCEYTEAVMHFSLDNWQLALPRLAASCRLEDCLADYTRLEILKDCICRRCSILATHRRLQQELQILEESTKPEAKPSSSKKRRLKEVRRMEARVRAAVEEGRIEDDLKDIRMEKVFSPASTKQAMIARPPPILALHINRSMHYGQYAAKNTVRLIFPEVLDLTPYTTSGSLSITPTSAISTPLPALPRSTTPTPATYGQPRIIYRLSAVVCHFGQHSFGHYICYRRKPKSIQVGADKRWSPPKLVDPLVPEEDLSESVGPRYVWEDDAHYKPGKGWLRISDDSVRECGIETVLQEGSGAFMLYYERAVQDRPSIYALANGSPRSSEETLKPEMKMVDLNGSVGSLVSEVGVGILQEKQKVEIDRKNAIGLGAGLSQSQTLGPRIVRSVATGRRSVSATPSQRDSSVASTSSSSEVHDHPESKSQKLNQVNGNAKHEPERPVPQSMTMSAPSLLPSKPSFSANSATPAPKSFQTHHFSVKQPSRIHSPQPHHSPAGQSSVVDLKA